MNRTPRAMDGPWADDSGPRSQTVGVLGVLWEHLSASRDDDKGMEDDGEWGTGKVQMGALGTLSVSSHGDTGDGAPTRSEPSAP